MPRPTGETDAGEPVYALRSVRLVLRGDAAHFNRLVPCASCRRDVMGPAVLGPGDLDQPVEPHTCADCLAKGILPSSPAAAPPAVDDRLDDTDRRVAELTQLVASVQAELLDQLQASDAGRLQAVEDKLGEVAARLRQLQADATGLAGQVAESLAAQREELQSLIGRGLAEARAAATPPDTDVADRLEALGKHMERNAGEMSELGELHAALDVGMGALRSEIIEVRSAVSRVASEQADVEDRLEAFVRGPAAAPEPGRGRKGRKAETGAQAGAVLAFTEDLARELQQLKAHVATLQQASDSATATAARASSQAVASSPFRSDVRDLQQQVAAQGEAIEGLRRRLAALAGKGAGPAPAAKVSRPSKKG